LHKKNYKYEFKLAFLLKKFVLTLKVKPMKERHGASEGGKTCLYSGPTRLSSMVTVPFVSRKGMWYLYLSYYDLYASIINYIYIISIIRNLEEERKICEIKVTKC